MLSHKPEVSDAARARELYKYYQPNVNTIPTSTSPSRPFAEPAPPEDAGSFSNLDVQSDVSSSKISSPDTALTAFCQLVAWRTGTQRAMISVIDSDTQHFIAESTKTLDLLDARNHTPGDGLWLGCSTVSKSGRLCERTIALPPAPAGQYPAFIVSDLSKDDRFNQLPFVTGSPFLKFYAGTPLITKRGIPIGSLFVVDDRARDGLSNAEVHFMGTMASTIMRHMEVVSEVEQHRRGMKMSRGLAAFVEGRIDLNETEMASGNGEGLMVAGQFEIADTMPLTRSTSTVDFRSRSQSESTVSVERKEKEYSSAIIKAEEDIMDSPRRSNSNAKDEQRARIPDNLPTVSEPVRTPSPAAQVQSSSKDMISPEVTEDSEEAVLKAVFARAANLIRDAFEVDGGSVFYDAQRGFASSYNPSTTEEKENNLGDTTSEESRSNSDSAQAETKNFLMSERQNSVSAKLGGEIFHHSSVGSDNRAEILAFSTPNASSVYGDEQPDGYAFTQFNEKSLQLLLRRYSRGKLWTFDEDGCISSSEDDALKPLQRVNTGSQSKKKRGRIDAEAAVLIRHFPGARQVLFVPLWDSSRSRWLGANFTWTTEMTHVLSKQNELAFLTAFGNSVMAEISRLDTEFADQKKGDFIGSISHELRSPLHGILASAEFLSEEISGTGLTFTKGLVDTIDSCGRTLLDTINHILDFSKINHLEKNWRRSRRAGHSISRPDLRTTGSYATGKANIPMINLFADVDISIICEEIVEGVFAGHVFQMAADSRGDALDNKRYMLSSNPKQDPEDPSRQHDVAVILDIDAHNYHFTTQPGALRRVILNLLTNSLKYTSRGYVKIKLEANELDDSHSAGSTDLTARENVILTITDTGKGISKAFISKLFTPFAQENPLSSGTGLGLSIVRSIVALLEGEITVQSELGRGTEVKVTLPLLRALPMASNSSGSTPKSMMSVPKESEEMIDQLRSRVIGKTVSVHGFKSDIEDTQASQANRLLKSSLENFLSNWYGLRVVSKKEEADIIIYNEPSSIDAAKLVHLKRNNQRRPIVLALYSHSSRHDRTNATTEADKDIVLLSKPIGPLKLARAISHYLDGIPATTSPLTERAPSGTGGQTFASTDLSSMFEDLSLSPSGEILDNARMAADSANARKAIESPTPTPGDEKQEEFPFPMRPDSPLTTAVRRLRQRKENPELIVSETDLQSTDVRRNVESTATSVSQLPQTLPPPRFLLVEDNKINLRLLSTYMRRRKHSVVDEAENGLEAVNATQNREEGYHVIMMDVSMPLMDGFEATRKIREVERTRRERAELEGTIAPSSALIIALTGLASSKDQSEAFTSGVDLFLTKPVAFKEVGQILDNWEANRDREFGLSDGASAGMNTSMSTTTSGSLINSADS